MNGSTVLVRSDDCYYKNHPKRTARFERGSVRYLIRWNYGRHPKLAPAHHRAVSSNSALKACSGTVPCPH
jgi:hypothetical protein